MERKTTEDIMEERERMCLLYDFYGALLKENKRRIFEANLLEDYSLTEIAKEEGISRQGVYDAMKRACAQLKEYEDRLQLVARFEKQKETARALDEELRSLCSETEKSRWERVFHLLNDLLNL